VLIVHGEGSQAGFAIVGSGNLSEGGLRTNIECSLLVDDPCYLSSLTNWFDVLFKQAQPLTRKAIEEYEPRYKKARRVLAKVRAEQKATEKILLEQQRVTFKNREKAIEEARGYFELPEYRSSHEKRLKAVGEIKRVLHYPSFSFDKEEWAEFFTIHEMGRLRLAWRDPLFKKAPRLKAALGFLVSDIAPDVERLSSLLDKRGKYRIRGLGINVVSKVLAVHNPATWPVYNDVVERTLEHFGYEAPRGVGMVGRYLLYSAEMRKFMQAVGETDMLALDSFFRWYYDKLKKP
jgi:hypothetical protein